MGEILENISVIDKLNFILQPLLFTHMLVTKRLPGEGGAMRVSIIPRSQVRAYCRD